MSGPTQCCAQWLIVRRYEEWVELMSVYHMSLSNATFVRHPKESVLVMFRDLRKRTKSRVVDGGLDTFYLDDDPGPVVRHRTFM